MSEIDWLIRLMNRARALKPDVVDGGTTNTGDMPIGFMRSPSLIDKQELSSLRMLKRGDYFDNAQNAFARQEVAGYPEKVLARLLPKENHHLIPDLIRVSKAPANTDTALVRDAISKVGANYRGVPNEFPNEFPESPVGNLKTALMGDSKLSGISEAAQMSQFLRLFPSFANVLGALLQGIEVAKPPNEADTVNKGLLLDKLNKS